MKGLTGLVLGAIFGLSSYVHAQTTYEVNYFENSKKMRETLELLGINHYYHPYVDIESYPISNTCSGLNEFPSYDAPDGSFTQESYLIPIKIDEPIFGNLRVLHRTYTDGSEKAIVAGYVHTGNCVNGVQYEQASLVHPEDRDVIREIVKLQSPGVAIEFMDPISSALGG